MRKLGGNDSYSNLIILDIAIHKLVHATDKMLIIKLLKQYKLDKKQLQKLNTLRKEAENSEIDENTLNLETENFAIN